MNKSFCHKIIFIVLGILCAILPAYSQTNHTKQTDWLPVYNFDANLFREPPSYYAPFTRWWWPGNYVDQDELKREVNLLADNGFGGVEIQTITNRFPFSNGVMDRIYSWDSPSYYDNLSCVMDEAMKAGLTVDLTNGSGWPTGGPYLKTEEGFWNLLFAAENAKGGKPIALALPTIENNTGVPSRLVAVLAAKTQPASNADTTTVQLEASSVHVITHYVKNDSLYWDAPEGVWKIIAFWSKPNAVDGSQVAKREQGPLLNLFDSLAVINSNNYLFGNRTGLEKYYGNPMRAIFTDSYEFSVDRHYSHDFISFFKERRGYDPTPWLPANMQKKYNYPVFANPNAEPYFAFSKEDWRLRYDYDLTVGELLEEHFIKTSSKWAENRNLLFRTQAYGVRLDMLSAAGHASIPETETMARGEAGLKIQSSGAHLYNRPIVSCETGVYMHRAYMTTPQKMRLIVDKFFAAGINQIIYHGFPYRFINDKTGEQGWYPFGNKYSTHIGEVRNFWQFQKEINSYICRAQYALRSGKPKADVLIYLPFHRQNIPFNPNELLKDGYFEGVENPLSQGEGTHFTKEEMEWAKVFYPFINQLEANGYTWDWVNDTSIQDATIDNNGCISIRGNSYQALALVNENIIDVQTAQSIKVLAKKGMNLLCVGELPCKQPSYLNWEKNDKLTENLIKQSFKQRNSTHLAVGGNYKAWFNTLNTPVEFQGIYNFVRQQKREMTNGSLIQFLWNTSDNWQPVNLKLNPKFKYAYWMDAETGSITSIDNLPNASYVIPPYSSIFLMAETTETVDENSLSKPKPKQFGAKNLLEISKWNVAVDTISILNTNLFDWRINDKLKYASQEATYTASFKIDNLNPHSKYFIDLGKVFYTAQMSVKGKPVGTRIYAPYSFDVTNFIAEGYNTIEVKVIPALLNGFIGKFENRERNYRPFRRSELIPAGMVGPVLLYKK